MDNLCASNNVKITFVSSLSLFSVENVDFSSNDNRFKILGTKDNINRNKIGAEKWVSYIFAPCTWTRTKTNH